MAFINYTPYGDKNPTDVWTSTNKEIQIWQELTMLRYIDDPNSIYAKETTASYIDQAKIYFLDAANSNWRSAGLLYYYSFLNLAKAYLLTNQIVEENTIRSTNIYHGLTSAPQNPDNIINFEIQIHPPGQNSNRNVFAYFYQTLIQEPWPFNNNITVKIEEVVAYCDDISHEFNNFYSIPKENIDVLSLTRKDNSHWWFEMLVPNFKKEIVIKNLNSCIDSVKAFNELTSLDKSDWLTAHNITGVQFQNQSLFIIGNRPFTVLNENEQYNQMIREVNNHFKGFILPTPSHNFELNLYWHFIPKITINNKQLKWHPLLSNYLFAFMLSSVLRYQPHLFPTNSKDAFMAEAWCNQSASTSLRYFLLELTKNNIRLN